VKFGTLRKDKNAAEKREGALWTGILQRRGKTFGDVSVGVLEKGGERKKQGDSGRGDAEPSEKEGGEGDPIKQLSNFRAQRTC